MKAFFSFLQRCAIGILVPLLISNWLPLFYERAWGLESAVTMLWWSFALSFIVFASGMWWALGSWGVERPWVMRALLLGSIMGLMNYGCALIAVHGLGTSWLASTIGLPSYLFQAFAVGAMIMNHIDSKRPAAQPS
jgi:hypothetical protein